MVKRKSPSPKAKKVIVKRMVMEETALSFCKGQEEDVPGGIWPIERGDDRYRPCA
jgi:hypothetical protein